jgi:hypothetical protein
MSAQNAMGLASQAKSSRISRMIRPRWTRSPEPILGSHVRNVVGASHSAIPEHGRADATFGVARKLELQAFE